MLELVKGWMTEMPLALTGIGSPRGDLSFRVRDRAAERRVLEKLKADPVVLGATLENGFVNLTLANEILLQRRERSRALHPLRTRVDFFGPNLETRPHLGIMRNLIFGNSVACLLRYSGTPVEASTVICNDGWRANGLYHLASLGPAQMDARFLNSEFQRRLEEEGKAAGLYVGPDSLSELMEDDRLPLTQAMQEFNGRKNTGEADRLIRAVTANAWRSIEKTLEPFGVNFDVVLDQFSYRKLTCDVVHRLGQAFAPIPLTNRYGEPTYLMRDLAALEQHHRDGVQQLVIVHGTDQQMHVARLLEARKRFEIGPPEIRPIEHGLVRFGNEARLPTFSDFLESERVRSWAEDHGVKLEVLRRTGAAGLALHFLSHDRQRDIVVDPVNVGAVFKVQVFYALQRYRSIEQSAASGTAPAKMPRVEKWVALLRIRLDLALQRALDVLDPAVVVRELMAIANEMNHVYQSRRFINDKEHTNAVAISTVSAAVTILQDGLSAVGITAPSF